MIIIITSIACFLCAMVMIGCCCLSVVANQHYIDDELFRYRYNNYVCDFKRMRIVGSSYNDDTIKFAERGFVNLFY